MTEESNMEKAFQYALGAFICARGDGKEPGEQIDISDLNIPLLETFFNAGWSWGEGERPDRCPTCFSSTLREPRAL